MPNKRIQKLAILLLISGLFLVSACSGATTTEGGTPAPTAQPTVWVTTFVTQIIATVPSPTASPLPTTTPFPTATLEWDPYSVPIYYPLAGCPASRLKKGDRATVASLDRPWRISFTEEVLSDPGIRDLTLGETLKIDDGPWCIQGYVVWKIIADSDKTEGFVAEGNGDEYWLLPLPPN
jgi:hypothetical protein